MKKQLLLFVMILLPVVAMAEAVQIDGIYYNLIDKAGEAEVTKNPQYYYGNIIIPESIIYNEKEFRVTSIGKEAFYYCKNLSNVTIPNGVTKINTSAFAGCSGLTSIIIPNSVTNIGLSSFAFCTGLTSITIPNSVTTIDHYAFQGCTGLSSISISNSITKIDVGVFQKCTGLTSITIPNSVTTIDNSAFAKCTGLSSISIPNSVTFLGVGAFRDCSGLTNIMLGKGISVLCEKTFANCPNISDVYCYMTTLTNRMDANAFENSYIEYATLHVPTSCISVYEENSPWKDFKSIVSLPQLIYMVDGNVYKSTTPIIGEVIVPEADPTKEGYTFSGWSEIPETMPAHDVTVTGTFNINSYKLIYVIDGVEYKSCNIEYGATITPEAEPSKEGYTFSGWSEIPETMPAHDVTVIGSFSINKYKLTYMVDGLELKSYDIEYGATITPETEPTKEGYTFSGWSEIPETMPAHDVTVTGTFAINSYKLTYMIDDKLYKETMYEYGATIVPEPQPEGNYETFEWIGLPQTMPAHDVVVNASYTITGIIEMLMSQQQNIRIYSPNGKMLDKPQKGLNIIHYNDGSIRKVVLN